jgi:DNA modification methylase
LKHLNELLAKGITNFSSANFSDAAAEFRKVARDIKRLEEQLFTAGIYTNRNSLNDLTGTEWLRHTKSWFVLDGKAADIDGEIDNHPGSFPPELATFFIEFFTKRGGMVLDPFMGIGSTLAAAASLQRNCIGFELNPQYAKYAQDRGNKMNPGGLSLHVHAEDARKIPDLWAREHFQPVNLCITSPPYWNMLATSRGGVDSMQKQRKKQGLDTIYSADSRDLGNIPGYDDYVATLAKVFPELPPQGWHHEAPRVGHGTGAK